MTDRTHGENHQNEHLSLNNVKGKLDWMDPFSSG